MHAYDPLHRPALAWASDGAASPLTLRERIAYGDGGRPDQAASERDVARAANLLGRVCRTYDESGVLAVDGTDFKGNVRQTTRRVVADAPILETYTAAAGSGWAMTPFTMDWTPGPGQTQDQRDAQLLEPTGYVTSTAYDALNRVTLHTLPSDVDGRRRLLRPSYNRAGALDSLLLDDTVYVAKAGYNAQGQRTVLAYGNGVLTRLRTEPYTVTGTGAYHPAGPVLQDCGYAYDLVGNPVALRDRTPGSGTPGNPAATAITDPVLRALIAGGDALDRSMRYDPAYRLLSATGREFQAPPPGAGWSDQPRGADLSGTQPYQERYSYDAVGGLRQLVHTSTGGFTRDFASADGTNRLTGLTIGATGYDYTTDAAGNITAETTSRHFTWNHAGRLSTFATQTPGAEPSVHAHYLYDATGRRVKKLVRRQGGAVEVTVYVHEDFEHHRWSGSSDGQNTVVHVRDDRRRVALVRIGPAHPDDRGPAVAVHLSDHLGSSVAVLDGTGALTSREEYSPYGETTFGSFTRKRYRFTGMERDGESGLGYHGARYLASWLGRWLSADPDGAGAGLHAFAYVSGNPMRLVDPTGHDGEPFPIGDDIKLGYKGKVWSKALHDDEPIVNPDGTELGKVSVLKVGVKANPKDLGVEGSLAVLDAEVKSPGAVGMVVSGAAAKAKIGVSKNGVAISLTAFEAGVGVAAGPVKAKVLFGAALGWQANWQTLKFEAKVAFPIGGELEVDVPAAGNAVWHTATHLAAGLRPPQPLPDLDLPSEPESVLQRIQEVAHETLPPAPAPPKPRAHRPPPKPASHGCESGADWPGRGGTAYVGGVRR